MAIKKQEILDALKADLNAANIMRTEWFNKMADLVTIKLIKKR